MGCTESREQRASKLADLSQDLHGARDAIWESAPLISSSIHQVFAAADSAIPDLMGQPDHQQQQQQQSAAMLSLSRQHERLILELFPFKDARQFHDWLSGSSVRGSWLEFRRDSARAVPAPAARGVEIDKAKAAQQAKDAIKSKSAKYLAHYPDKSAWTLDDHIVRFIAVVVSDNLLSGLWSSGDWSNKSLDITKAVYEVLIFLRSTDPGLESGPPGYSA